MVHERYIKDKIDGNGYVEVFLDRLREIGLEMEEEIQKSKTKGFELLFIKIHVPWSVLIEYAEELSLNVPLDEEIIDDKNWSESVFNCLRIPNPMSNVVDRPPKKYYTCKFKKSKLTKYFGHEDRENFFNTTQRIRIIHEILETRPYGSENDGKVNMVYIQLVN